MRTALLTLGVVGILGDLITTYAALRDGEHPELNPVGRAVLGRLGLVRGLLLGGTIRVGLLLTLPLLDAPTWAYAVVAGPQTLPLVWNLTMLALPPREGARSTGQPIPLGPGMPALPRPSYHLGLDTLPRVCLDGLVPRETTEESIIDFTATTVEEGRIKYARYFRSINLGPRSWEVSIYFATEAERDEFLAKFPKSVKARATSLSTYLRDGTYTPFVIPGVHAYGKVAADGVNGGVNETGNKRYLAAKKVVDASGLAYRFTTN